MHWGYEPDLYKLSAEVFGNTVKVDICIHYDPAIPLLGIYLTKIYTYVDQKPCTRMFIEVLLLIA